MVECSRVCDRRQGQGARQAWAAGVDGRGGINGKPRREAGGALNLQPALDSYRLLAPFQPEDFSSCFDNLKN
jgi:hypothetical protein